MVLVCLNGSCEVNVVNSKEESFFLTNPSQGLFLEPEDWHTMDKFSEGAVLLALASEEYDKGDYFFERPL